jgi:glycosyltransferase involved in cell wall biosynthesis
MIIIEDGQMPSQTLADIADIYVYHKKNIGFTANVNKGWELASGEYVMIVNSDTTLLHGCNLKDLCVPGKVTSPLLVNQYIDRLAGPFWCSPREVTNEYGYLLEELKTYSSDSEYDERVKDIFQKVPSVQIYHEMAQSVTAAGIEGGDEQERDRQIYAQLQREGKAK